MIDPIITQMERQAPEPSAPVMAAFSPAGTGQQRSATPGAHRSGLRASSCCPGLSLQLVAYNGTFLSFPCHPFLAPLNVTSTAFCFFSLVATHHCPTIYLFTGLHGYAPPITHPHQNVNSEEHGVTCSCPPPPRVLSSALHTVGAQHIFHGSSIK